MNNDIVGEIQRQMHRLESAGLEGAAVIIGADVKPEEKWFDELSTGDQIMGLEAIRVMNMRGIHVIPEYERELGR